MAWTVDSFPTITRYGRPIIIRYRRFLRVVIGVCLLLLMVSTFRRQEHLFVLRPWYTDLPPRYTPRYTHLPLELRPIAQKASPKDVVEVDQAALLNVAPTLEEGTSRVQASKLKVEQAYQVAPLFSTIDRRLTTIQRQLQRDSKHQNGVLLGCAYHTNTLVVGLERIDIKRFGTERRQCHVCLEFHQVVGNSVPLTSMNLTRVDPKTLCLAGHVFLHHTFVDFQQKTYKSRPRQNGYPITVDCELPNGDPMFTCSGLTDVSISSSSISKVYVKVEFSVGTLMGDVLQVTTKLPWAALRTHDDDRQWIARSLPAHARDTTSHFIPTHAAALQVVFTEGPSYTTTKDKEGTMMMTMGNDSPGGINPRLIANLHHQMRVAPNSTRLVGIVSKQIEDSKRYLTQRLQTTMVQGESMYTALQRANVNIVLIPLAMSETSFQTMLCGGQYGFSTYMLARYAPEWQVMLYLDGDATVLEGPEFHLGLREVLYSRMYVNQMCVDQRFRLVESHVPESEAQDDRVLECAFQVQQDPARFDLALSNCSYANGHIAARVDGANAMDVHFVSAEKELLPPGLRRCQWDEEFYVPSNEFIELHLTPKRRASVCTCFHDKHDQ